MKEKSELSVDFFKGGYNCAQAVVLSYCEDLNIDKETMMKLSSSFGVEWGD